MDFPLIPRQLLEEAVIEGNIYFFEKNATLGVPGHMHVCVKRADRLLFFSTCSSQIQTAQRLSLYKGWDINTFPVFAANEKTNRFVASLTYVNCNRCYDIPVAEFVDMMERGEVRLLKGSFTEDDMSLIRNGVLKSSQIPREVKALFNTENAETGDKD